MLGVVYDGRGWFIKNTKYCIYNTYFLSIIRYLMVVWSSGEKRIFNKR